MAEYDNRNTFILFTNDKNGNAKAPDYKGNFTDENNNKLDIAAWSRVSAKGTEFLTGKISQPRSPMPQQQKPVGGVADMDEDLPF